MVSKVIPPEDSVSTRPAMMSTAFLVSATEKLSSMMRSTPPWSSTCRSSSNERTSISILSGNPFSSRYLWQRSMALTMPPAKSTWLSLSRIMSKRPIRWLQPPPILTACFSSIRIPGVVLRVSNTRVLVPLRRCTYLSVMVAMPLMRCMMLSMRRSVWSSERTRPVTTIAMSPFLTRVPSCISTSTCISGSKRRNTSLATSTPARIPSSLMSRCDLPIASAGMQHKVVWSPSPMSSANDRSMSLSTSCLTSISKLGL